MTSKQDLFAYSVNLLQQFCFANDRLKVPQINILESYDWPFGTCAYYRVEPSPHIEICIKKCAHIGTAGASWSYPGYIIDRTPFGVLQHELGHHADAIMSGLERGYIGEYSIDVRKRSGEEKLTNYCPNDAEWFAEMFRLFVTNPDLLRCIRPRTYALICEDFKPLRRGNWQTVLIDAPQRTKDRAHKLFLEALNKDKK